MVRPRFDLRKHAAEPMVAATEFTYNGVEYSKGDPFPTDGLDPRKTAMLHGARRINFDSNPDQRARDERADRRAKLTAEDPVTVTPKPGGNYEITAAWLAGPVKIKGKAKAQAKADEIRKEGPPLGFIEGGSEVTVSEAGGGWYDVAAPWLEAPEKVQGRDLAEKRQRELHEAGAPAPKPLEAGDVVLVGDDAPELAGRYGTINSIEGDTAEVFAFGDTEETKGDLTKANLPLASLTRAQIENPPGGNAEGGTVGGTGQTQTQASELPEGGGSESGESTPTE